jgi:hypothetical protein
MRTVRLSAEIAKKLAKIQGQADRHIKTILFVDPLIRTPLLVDSRIVEMVLRTRRSKFSSNVHRFEEGASTKELATLQSRGERFVGLPPSNSLGRPWASSINKGTACIAFCYLEPTESSTKEPYLAIPIFLTIASDVTVACQ